MARNEKADVTVVSVKGQVVIPHAIRQKLGIGPRTRLLVYGHNDAVIMKKIDIPDVVKDLERLYARIDKKVAKFGPLSDADIDNIISESRRKRNAQ
ncbi:MAG TPA: AbrB/MazE/SpoVT family DNA-binding domain-containing protein [Nitrososphaera sp.]|jgi:AbrB family looped-hinge helix DNA binding protein|nr:AbrB/MazE/SpoVT family DNA-binding domain-containing protein [Nitrososphaera sp.]